MNIGGNGHTKELYTTSQNTFFSKFTIANCKYLAKLAIKQHDFKSIYFQKPTTGTNIVKLKFNILLSLNHNTLEDNHKF